MILDRLRVVHFRALEKPNEDVFCLELSILKSGCGRLKLSYEDVTQRVASHLGLDNSAKVRLTLHNCEPPQPRCLPIKFQDEIYINEDANILYYEVLQTSLHRLQQDFITLNIAFHHAGGNEVCIRSITLPIGSTVRDLLIELKTKVEISHPWRRLRLLGIFDLSIQKIYRLSEEINLIHNESWTLRAEEISVEEQNLGPLDYLIPVQHHYIKHISTSSIHQRTDPVWQKPRSYWEPFLLRVNDGETLAEIKVRAKKKLQQVPDYEFNKWKFKLPIHTDFLLNETDVLSTHFVKERHAEDWELYYLILEHRDNINAQSRADAPNQKILKIKHVELRNADDYHEVTLSQEYPSAGKLYEEGRYHHIVLDEKFEDIGGFSVLKTQASFYKQIWLKYGHIATSQVLSANTYSAQVTVVSEIMKSIIDMDQLNVSEVSSPMIDEWEDKIKMAEKLEFNIRWFRKRVEDVKEHFCVVQKSLEKRKKLSAKLLKRNTRLLAAQMKVNRANARLIKAEKKVNKIQKKIASENRSTPSLSRIAMDIIDGGKTGLLGGLF